MIKRPGVVAWGIALSTIVSVDRVVLALSRGRIAADLHLNDARMGFVFSAYATAYALCEVPSGYLGDRFGPRRVLLRIAIWWTAFMAATTAAFSFASMYLTQLLFGAGQSGCFPNIARLFSQSMTQAQMVRAQGSVWLGARWAGAFTPLLVAVLFRCLTWRQTFAAMSILGLAWAIPFYRWSYGDTHRSAPLAPQPSVKPWGMLAQSGTVRLLCGQYLALVFQWFFLITWAPTFIDERFHVDATESTILKVLPLFFGGIGALISGMVSGPLGQRLGLATTRRAICCVGFAGASAGLILAAASQNPVAAVLAVSVSSFCNDLVMPVTWATAADVGGVWSATVAAMMNMADNAGGALYGLTAGLVLERTHHDWSAVLYMGAIVYLAGLPIWLALDPVRRID